MDDKRNNQRDGDYRHHPIQCDDQPKPAHFGEIDLKNKPTIGLTELASREAVLICINGLAVTTGSVSLRAYLSSDCPTRRLTLAAPLLVATGVSRLYQSIA